MSDSDQIMTDDCFLREGRTYLRAFGEHDLPHLSRWWNDSRVTEYLEMGARPTRSVDLERFYSSVSKSDDTVCFAICDSESGALIGTCGLYLISWVARRAQFNILVGEPSAWDQGHGGRATRMTVRYGFETLNLNSINLGVNAENIRAVRSYEKAGFVREGLRRSFIFRNGRYYDMAVYSILRNEYDALLDGKR